MGSGKKAGGRKKATGTRDRNRKDTKPKKTDTAAEPSRDWTVMVYFAIKDPGHAGREILGKIKQVGSHDKIALLAYVNPEGNGTPNCYRLRKDTLLDEDIVFHGKPHDPSGIQSFIEWGFKDYQAKNYMLIL